MRALRRLPFLLPLAVSLPLAGCFYPADRGRALELRVDKLDDGDQALKKQLAAEQQKLQTLAPEVEAKLAEVSQALAELDKAEHQSGADTGVRLQKTVEQIADLRGQLQLYQHRIEVLESDVTALQKTASAHAAVAVPPTPKAPPPLVRPKTARAYLKLAEEKTKSDLQLGRQLFRELLKKWPKGKVAGKAHFELGETYYGEHDGCRQALYEYGKVIQNFPKTKSAPTAYLHSGDCFAKLKMHKEAKLAYRELIRGFPKSSAAKSARKKLVELEHPKHSSRRSSHSRKHHSKKHR